MFVPYAHALLQGGVCLANDKAKQELKWHLETQTYRLGLDRLPYEAADAGSAKRHDSIR
jgi:hypothetical protein